MLSITLLEMINELFPDLYLLIYVRFIRYCFILNPLIYLSVPERGCGMFLFDI